MDWINISELPQSRFDETLWFKVNGEVKKGTYNHYWQATHWTELDTVY